METTNGCSTSALKAMKGSLLTAKLQIVPSSVHLKIHCGAENLVALEGNRVFKKTPKENYVIRLVV